MRSGEAQASMGQRCGRRVSFAGERMERNLLSQDRGQGETGREPQGGERSGQA